jgi:hypothetical protein
LRFVLEAPLLAVAIAPTSDFALTALSKLKVQSSKFKVQKQSPKAKGQMPK